MNNRELAFLIWISIIILIFLFQKNVKESIVSVIQNFFKWKLSILFLITFSYVLLIVYFLFKLSFWNESLLKDSIIWTVFAGMIMLINSNEIFDNTTRLKKSILDNLKFVTVIEFITNAYVFNIFIELIIVPALIFFSLISVYSTVKKEYEKVKVLTDFVLTTIGLIIFIYALSKIALNFKDFTTINNLKSFLLPPIMTLLFLPFLYFVSLYMTYEMLFIRINVMHRQNSSLIRIIKFNILKSCSINLFRLNKFSRELRIYEIEKPEDIKLQIKKLKKIFKAQCLTRGKKYWG